VDETMTNTSTSKLSGRRLSLDYANTADWHASDHPVESLTSYSELVGWSERAGILTENQAQPLLDIAEHHPADATAVLQRAIVLREAIYHILSAVSHAHPPQTTDIATFNTELSRALSQSRVAQSAEGFVWEWTGDDEHALDRMLWPVVHDAAGLLTSKDLDRVGQCADDRCGWLFLDTSRNHSRRWCSMKDCGNRAKARRHYQRSRTLQELER
jgi:predicted RNA-binding Zn ribbon-like protein